MVPSNSPDLPRLRHVAISMNGNRTWARQHRLLAHRGHEYGRTKLKEVIRWSIEYGLECLTVFAFSTENWGRPAVQVRALMRLLELVLDEDVPELHQQGVRIRVLGSRTRLKPTLVAKMDVAQELTQANRRLLLQVCFNYGAQADILAAVEAIQRAGKPVSVNQITRYLSTYGSPPLDLQLRTGGEQRLSNFLLWEAAYAELAFTPTLWPELTREEYLGILADVARRERKFGR